MTLAHLRSTALVASSAALVTARQVVDDAQRYRVAAVGAEETAIAELAAISISFGDYPSPDLAHQWRNARDVRELATLAVAGAERRLAAAQEAHHVAGQEDARERLADALPRASRVELFDALYLVVLDLAACDAVPRVDAHRDASEDLIAVLLGEQGQRDAAAALHRRMIRKAVTEQHQAVAEARAAAAELGQGTAASPVPEAHILSAVALEVYALGSPEVADLEWFRRWFIETFDPEMAQAKRLFPAMPMSGTPDEMANAFGNSAEHWIAWARETIRTGAWKPAIASVMARLAA